MKRRIGQENVPGRQKRPHKFEAVRVLSTTVDDTPISQPPEMGAVSYGIVAAAPRLGRIATISTMLVRDQAPRRPNPPYRQTIYLIYVIGFSVFVRLWLSKCASCQVIESDAGAGDRKTIFDGGVF
jgi:hypothetical protein